MSMLASRALYVVLPLIVFTLGTFAAGVHGRHHHLAAAHLHRVVPVQHDSPCLVLTYALWGRKHVLSFSCFIAMIMSSATLVISLGLVWWIQVRACGDPRV